MIHFAFTILKGKNTWQTTKVLKENPHKRSRFLLHTCLLFQSQVLLNSIFFIIILYKRELNCDQLSFTTEYRFWIRKYHHTSILRFFFFVCLFPALNHLFNCNAVPSLQFILTHLFPMVT